MAYPKQNSRRSGGNAGYTILWILVIFLCVGFVANLVSDAPNHSALEETKPSATDSPTEDNTTEPTEDSSSGLPSFTLHAWMEGDGDYGGPHTFYFEEGMTWQQWCDSEYNTVNAVCSENRVSVLGSPTTSYDVYEVSPSDLIVADRSYGA